MTIATPLVEVRDVHTFYDESHVLRGVSLRLGVGETLGLMGRNGMGKSTLVRTIMGLVRPRSGSIAIAGREVTGEPTFRIARSGLSYVPEGRGIFASLSVAENMAIAERPGVGGARTWTAERVLDLFPRLAQRLHNRGDELSGGEQQMLAIARALLGNPRALILDEATEGLAPMVRAEIWRTLRLVRETGIATLIIDKSIMELATVAERVVILVKGEIAFEGTPAALRTAPDVMHRHLGV